ncbi:MAG TPA: penicillin-binding protein 2 [Myxococcota bacterium]|nr:penicillin-binding protein 2 [Myxococcota bacterium]
MNRLTATGSPSDATVERRLTAIAVLVVAVWMLLLTRLFYLQVVQGDVYRISAERNSVRTQRVDAPRGVITDRNGEVLVGSRPSFDVLVVPHETEDVPTTLSRIAGLTGRELETVRAGYGEPRGRARFQPQRVAHDLDRDALARVEARLWALGGVLTQVTPVRGYRFGDSAAHLVGWLGEIGPDQLGRKEFQAYRRGDIVGVGGIEKLLDTDLRGRPGGRNLLVDAHGRELQLLSSVEPEPGRNVVLTIDHRLQEAAESALTRMDHKSGAVVALDPRTGEVLALVSHPAFDPNEFAIGIDPERWRELTSDPFRPLMNRALQGQYPPGSTYKVVTAIAGLEEKLVGPHSEVTCGGSFRLGRRTYRCWRPGGHGVVDLHTAIVQSCDVFFYKLGVDLGVDRLAYYARQLGLGARTGIDLSGEMTGLVPTQEWKERRDRTPWVEGDTVSLSIGQGMNLWTPLQLASAYAAIVNGGVRYRPHVLKRIEEPDGRIVKEIEPEVIGELAISPQTLATVRAGLVGVVQEPHGTGAVMKNLPGGVIAGGKTGTAQVVGLPAGARPDEEDVEHEDRDHAWFVTFVPADSPRLVVSVLVEHGGHGGSAAAPIARDVVTRFLEGEADLYAGNRP